MISRPLVILLALGAAVYRFSTGAVLESGGLFALALGLVFLQLAPRRPALRTAAFACFAITAGIIGYVVYLGSR